MALTIKDWQKHQHFVRKRPTWIKLHHEILNDRRFIRLPVASRALLPVLWLLASEFDRGEIQLGIGDVAFRLHWSEESFVEAIRPCIDVGFIRWPEFGAPGHENADDLLAPLSNGNHSAIPSNANNLKQSKATDDSESESESERERETHKRNGAPRIAKDWEPSEEGIRLLRVARPDLVGKRFSDRMQDFREWCLAKAVTSHDPESSWSSFMRQTHKRTGGGGRPGRSHDEIVERSKLSRERSRKMGLEEE